MRPVPIDGADGYFVDEHGAIWTTRPAGLGRPRSVPHALKPWACPDGYLHVNLHLRIGGAKKLKRYGVHALVALAFHGERPNDHVVRHLDGNRTNNTPSNLAWGTVQENARDTARHGSLRGQRNARAVMTDARVAELREFAGVVTQEELARRFGISQVQVSRIVRRRAWKDTTPAVDVEKEDVA